MVQVMPNSYYVAHTGELRFAEVDAASFELAVVGAFREWGWSVPDEKEIKLVFDNDMPVIVVAANDANSGKLAGVSGTVDKIHALTELNGVRRFQVPS